jgi:hypothetical protein
MFAEFCTRRHIAPDFRVGFGMKRFCREHMVDRAVSREAAPRREVIKK